MRKLALLVLLVGGSAVAGPSVETLWKARGLEAKEKLDRMRNGRVATRIPKLTAAQQREEAWRIAIEWAFYYQVENPGDIFHKPLAGGAEEFRIILKGNRKGDAMVLDYFYDKFGRFSFSQVESLPDHWSVVVTAKPYAGILLSTADNVLIGFPIADPFHPEILDASEAAIPSLADDIPNLSNQGGGDVMPASMEAR